MMTSKSSKEEDKQNNGEDQTFFEPGLKTNLFELQLFEAVL